MHPLALLLLGLRLAGAGFKICAFNAHGFGEAKSGDTWVMGALILVRCDIAAVQEVRDVKGDAMQALLRELNRYDPSHSYAQLGSRRLGRGTYKEQIVFLYRADLVTVTDWYQFGEAGDFARGPFAARFHVPSTAIKDFVLLSHHVSPRDAPHEIDQLHQVCQELSQRWGTQNMMVLGDLNAGGAYVPHNAWGSIRLRWDPRFHWLIGDGVNTTVRARTHCATTGTRVAWGDQHGDVGGLAPPIAGRTGGAESPWQRLSVNLWGKGVGVGERLPLSTLQSPTLGLLWHWCRLEGRGKLRDSSPLTPSLPPRIVVQGDELLRAVVPGSAKPYNFARSLGLSEEEALQVSDHYPVEVNLYLAGQAPREL
ncbi:LOW QUALITY PROTEIN: deoxyribonuclease-1 [Caretta caretta]|uniref:LOW QUALITY PROTEIN: deoxyribonuclease-1 n=1 Tax=Caretta caretta TaxID=8467 RepID=UPI003F4AFD3B